ncbi:MAG: alpha/beta hydrolase [Desulfamplus sp.]|nr:alpha/beta hydrolase [Desulfamplus sp.]
MSNITISNKQTIYYELIDGDKSKPYLIFLHEGLGCVAMYKNFHNHLCAKTNCPGLAYDRAGYGKSSPLIRNRTVNYLHEYALNELPELIDAIIPDKPFILIGHSDGGSISLIYGSERPDYLKGVVTAAAHVFVDQMTIDGIIKANAAFAAGKLSGLFKLHGEKTDSIFKAWSSTWLSDWFKHWNIEYLLPSVNVPLLVIQGKDDQYGAIAQVNSIVSKSSGKAEQLLIDGCGHSPHQDAPELVIDAISEFIDRLEKAEE